MVNQVVLVGRITRDVELKMTTTSREVCNFSIAVNRNFKNANGEYDADFVNCVAYGQPAKFMSQYIQKGRLISVTGRIQTRNYDNASGQRIYVTEVVADNVNALEARRDDLNQNQSFNQQLNQQQPTTPESFMKQDVEQDISQISDDDLPF